jgi:hypothetical protein
MEISVLSVAKDSTGFALLVKGGSTLLVFQEPSDAAKLVQFVFRDEISARKVGSFTVVKDNIMRAEAAGEVSVSLNSTYESSDSSGGSVKVKSLP